MRHGFVFAADLEHRTAEALGLDAVVSVTELFEQVDAGFLEPADIVGVMDDTHTVRLDLALTRN